MAHDQTANSFRNRSTVFKGHPVNSGAEWENCIGLSGIRWAPPSLTFSQHADLHWNDQPLILEHHPGPTPGAIWVILPEAQVVFVGDTVLSNQPPFLASADLPAWIEALDLLVSTKFRNHLVISGRSGPVALETLREQRRSLKYIKKRLETLASREVQPEATETMIPRILGGMDYPPERDEQYRQRLAYGLSEYYTRHYLPGETNGES